MRYLSILISLLLCLSLLSCGNLEPKETIDSSSDNESDTTADNLDESTVPGESDPASESDETEPVIDISLLSDEEYFADYFTPVLRFVVASDVHIVARKCVEEERFAELFKQAYAYSDSHEKYNNLDGIFIVGDCTDNGSPSEFNKFFSIIEENAREGTVVRAVMGNHDYWYNRQTAPVLFKNASGYDDIDAHLVINGFHFIMLSPRERGNAFSADQQNWLRTKLREAADSDETGTRPIFVFNHQHISGTVYGSEDWGNPELKDELFIYPQAIDFSGHSHYPLSDPRSIWQGEFTALGTGSLSYFDMGLAGLKTVMHLSTI